MYVQPLDGSLTPNLGAPAGGAESEGTTFGGAPAPAAGDAISRFAPPWSNENAAAMPFGDGYGGFGSLQGMFGPLMGILQQLMQMMQSLMGYGCGSINGNGGNCQPYGNERYFQNANGSSDGDPHLSFNGLKLFLVAYMENGLSEVSSAKASSGRLSSDDIIDCTQPDRRRMCQ